MYLNKHWKTCPKGIDVIINVISANQHFTSTSSMKACVTERFTPRTLDLEVHGSSLVHRVFSLDKELYPTSPRCINGCNGLKHPIQRGVAILLGMLHATETGISFGHLGLWLVCAFTYCRCLNSRDIVESCPSFSHLAARAPWRACSQATHCLKYDKYQKGLSLGTVFTKETEEPNNQVVSWGLYCFVV